MPRWSNFTESHLDWEIGAGCCLSSHSRLATQISYLSPLKSRLSGAKTAYYLWERYYFHLEKRLCTPIVTAVRIAFGLPLGRLTFH